MKKNTASKKLSFVFIALANAYLIIILVFNSSYNSLFTHKDKSQGMDHRTSRNMFHQFSKENYFHSGGKSGMSQRNIDVKHDKDAFVEGREEDENMIVISQEEGHETITPMKIPSNVRKFVAKKELSADRKKSKSKLGSLSCKAYGGPDDETAQKEMVYWKDIPEDQEFISPYKKHDKERYLTFEPDGKLVLHSKDKNEVYMASSIQRWWME